MADELIEQYQKLHSENEYGNTSVKNLPHFAPLLADISPKTIIDFGCGQSTLHRELNRLTGADVTRYDPAIPEISTKPSGTFDLLFNVDVLEHIPEEDVDGFIAEMASLADNAVIVIDLGPAVRFLEDGRNAHVTQRPAEWWQEKLAMHFDYLETFAVRSKRRAAFKTWPTTNKNKLRNSWLHLREEVRYKIWKLRK